MSRRTMPVTTERLEELSSKASDIIQKTAEAVGTLKIIDEFLEENEATFESRTVWALRNAIRNIESATEDALWITDTIEQFEEIKTMNNHTIGNVIKQSTSRMNIILLATNWTTDKKRREYYSSLDKADLASNIELLFNDLKAMHTMLVDEVMELEELSSKLQKDNTHVQ